MVGPLTVMKVLHCRDYCTKSPKMAKKKEPVTDLLRRTSRNSKLGNISNDIKHIVKQEPVDELCRICLKQGNIPIYGEDNSNEDLADAINTFGGIEINTFDAYPKYLCKSCHALLQGAILFKKTAQESDEQLRKVTKPEPEIEDTFSDSWDNNDESSSFNISISSTSKKKPKPMKCRTCDLEFNTFEEYQEHRLSDDHENQKKTCPICNKEYRRTYIRKHMLLHTKETLYICDVCGKRFVQQSQFTRHRITHFYNSLPFKCSLCPYKGRFTESLKMHMKSHTGEKAYICAECPQRFVNKSNLNKHMLTHKKEKDFNCECGRGFYTKKELDMHFKVEHVGVKDHICQMCGKAFGYRKQLMKHQLKVHKREKLRSGRMPVYLKAESLMQQENDNALTT